MEEKDIARLYEIRAARKALEAEEKELLAELKALAVDDYAVGPFRVRVTPNRRFDANLAAEAIAGLSEAKQRLVTKRVVDSALLKALHPDLFVASQREYAPKVEVDLP